MQTRPYAHRSSPTAHSSSIKSVSSIDAGFRRFLQPTLLNGLIWLTALAIAALLLSTINAHSQLSNRSETIVLPNVLTSPPSHTYQSQVLKTSSVGMSHGAALLRDPALNPAPVDLDQVYTSAGNSHIDAKQRLPPIHSKRLDLLRNIISQLPQTLEGVTAGHSEGEHKQVPSPFNKYPLQEAPGAPKTATSPASSSPSGFPSLTDDIPLLVFTFNRPQNLKETIESLVRYRPAHGHPIFISQDGGDVETKRVAMEFVDNNSNNPLYKDIHYLNFHWEEMNVQVDPQFAQWPTYFKIATHYGWAIRQVMDGGLTHTDKNANPPKQGNGNAYDHVILIEDDMHIAPDFYSYFRRTGALLDRDPTLLCVSAWNDNGRGNLVASPEQLYRSECFPGLGWLLNRRIWDEMNPKWPRGFWDDWLREPQQRKARSCIFPEMNRVYTFGEKGSSAGQFFDQYLRGIQLNEQNIDWSTKELPYLDTVEHYRAFLHRQISKTTLVNSVHDVDSKRGGDFRLEYEGLQQLDTILMPLNMMTDHKAGIPRTSFEGVLQFTRKANDARFFIVPRNSGFLQPLTQN